MNEIHYGVPACCRFTNDLQGSQSVKITLGMNAHLFNACFLNSPSHLLQVVCRTMHIIASNSCGIIIDDIVGVVKIDFPFLTGRNESSD